MKVTRDQGPLVAAALLIAILIAILVGQASAARAESDPCREWLAEHRHWKKEVVGRYLSPVGQQELDEAVFDLIRHEAYLTSCDTSLGRARVEQVGWRLVGRLPDEYALAVVESVLEAGGFDLTLRSVVATPPAQAASAPRVSNGRAR